MMEKFISYEKLSKKEKRKLNSSRRRTWGPLNPVTRKPANSKAYNRKKARDWKRDYHEPTSGLLFYQICPARGAVGTGQIQRCGTEEIMPLRYFFQHNALQQGNALP